MTPPASNKVLGGHLKWIAGLAVLLVVVVGGWAATTKIAGAVVSHGNLVSASYVKKVQHATGGTVSRLAVVEGQRVAEGQVLLALDDTQPKANLAIFHSDLLQLKARRIRLLTEQAEATGTRPVLPGESAQTRAELEPLVRSEMALLAARRALRQKQLGQLGEQIAGTGRQIEGYRTQAASHARQIGLVEEELKGVRKLYEEGYAPMSTLKGLERQSEGLSGERGQLNASAAQAENRIAEARMQTLQIEAQHLAEVLSELRDVEGKIAELSEKEVSAQDQVAHVEVRAPQTGYVHQLAVHTIGGVVTPAEPIMLIVPANDALSVEAKIPPQSIDQVTVGRPARVKFSGLDRSQTSEVTGAVSRVGADLQQDQRTGETYYLARIDLPPREIAKLGGLRLVPGMPVEIHVQTGQRTVLSYLLKPLRDEVSRAFTER